MDKTLNRPLFKKRAQEIHTKVNPKQVPKFFVGGLAALGSAGIQGARALAAPAYRYLAPKMSSFFARPGVQTGLVGLEGYGIGVGSREMAEGIKEGDTGKFISGATYAVPGAAFLPGSAKRAGISALRETGEYLTPRMTDLAQKIVRNPGKTTLTAIGAGTASPLLSPAGSPEGMTQEDYLADVQDRLIYSKPEYKPDPKKKVTENLKEYREMSKEFQARPIGIKNPKTEEEQLLNDQLKTINKIDTTAKTLGVDLTKASDEQLKQIAIETNVDESTVRQMLGKGQKQMGPQEMAGPGDTGGEGGIMPMNPVPKMTGDEGPAEIAYLKNKRTKDLQGGKEISGTLAGQFKQFKDELNKLTGTSNENLNNLLMMRAAGTLLSGKSPQTGMAGFLDVAGQALGSTADAMIGMKLQQQKTDMDLAKAFLKMKQEKEKGVGMLTTGDKTIRVNDPSLPGGFKNVRVSLGKDNKYYVRQFNPETGEQSFAPADFTGTDIKRNDEKLNAALMGLEDNRRGGKMIDFVIQNAEKGGTKAALGLLAEDSLGTFDFFAGGNLGADSSVIDQQIVDSMENNTSREFIDFEGGKVNLFNKEANNMKQRFNNDLQEAKENGAKQVEKQLKKAGLIAENYRPTEEDLRAYTKLALIEQRMKYIVANANKSEDRLTQKDIDNAAKRTQIIKYITSPRTIRLNYEQLRDEFNEKAGSYLNQYKLNGGDEDFIQNNFMDIPGVSAAYNQKNQEYMRQQAIANQQSRSDILSTIPIGG
jgi:hypothetical protein